MAEVYSNSVNGEDESNGEDKSNAKLDLVI
jgi:hypothetical protein